jgi:hypothetical protein
MAAVLFLASCSALPGLGGYYTPQEAYQHASALDGKTITVRGKVEVVSSSCTLEVCPEGTPCCHGCYHQLGFNVDEHHNIHLTGEGSGCLGDSCHTECPSFNSSEIHEVTGTLTTRGGFTLELEMAEWRIAE